MTHPQPTCPVKAAHNRLMDCHAQWHAASVAYMEPDDFRQHLNALVQNLRNVSWLLQKQKNDLPAFAAFYEPWQDASRQDPVMRWVIKARNRITKEADLEINSTAKVIVISSFYKRDEQVITVPPRLTTRQMLRQMRERVRQSDARPREAAMTLERRWVDAALPEWEVLEACAHALESLRGLLKTAHEKAIDDTCTLETRSLPCITASLEPRSLDCLVDDQEFRRAHLSLWSLGELVGENQTYSYDPALAAEAAERYGITKPFDAGLGPIAMAPAVFEQARRVLTQDGHHVGILWLFRGEDVVWMQPLQFEDQVAKYVTMDAIGRKAASLHADGFLCLAETWVAQPRPDEDLSDVETIIPARARPDRMEALHLVGMTADGQGAEYLNIFTRAKDGSIVLGEDSVHVGSDVDVSGIYAPLMQHWTAAKTTSPH